MSAAAGFWDFSIRTYSSEGVSESCLALQNDRGADVNMLLYCCWVASVHGEFDDDLFETASRFSRSWTQQVVRPLREIRTWMKRENCHDDTDIFECRMQLRENVKRIELEAEKLQQTTLEALVAVSAAPAVADQLRSAAANLRRYCRTEAIDIDVESVERLSVILSAAIPSATRDSARELLT